MMRSRDRHTGAGKTWLARATVLAVGAATLTVPLGIMTAAEAARIQPRTTSPTSTLAVIKTIGVGAYPEGVAVNNEDDTVYVTNTFGGGAGADNVSVINGRTGQRTDDTIPVGDYPQGIAVDQNDDTVYVANQLTNDMSVINGRTNTRDDTITFVGNSNPNDVAVDSVDDTVYVAFGVTTNVAVVNGRTRTYSTVDQGTGAFSQGVAVNEGDDTVYVANYNYTPGRVSVLNGRIPSLAPPQITVGTNPRNVAVNQDDDTVYVTNYSSNTVGMINGRTQTGAGTISAGVEPWDVAVDQRDDTVYVTNQASNSVSVINGRTGQRTDDTVTVGTYPRGLAVDDSGTNAGLVYVANRNSDTVSVIGRVTPTLAPALAAAGSTASINLDVPQVDYDVDDSTVSSVTFGTTVIPSSALTPRTGDEWEFAVPAGSGTVSVTVTFNGGLTASAGSFTYSSTPTPTPTPPPPAPTYPPGPPTGVLAVAGDDTALVTWTPPTNSGAGPITSYYVYSTPRTGSCTATPPATSCVMTGLTNGTTYTFQVQAINIDGASSPSAPSNEVTPGVTPPPPSTPTITITGTRDDKRIVVTGTSTELAGMTLRPWIRFPGQTSYSEGLASITPAADGSFTWQRKTGKKTSVYIAHEDTRSNTVIIPARR